MGTLNFKPQKYAPLYVFDSETAAKLYIEEYLEIIDEYDDENAIYNISALLEEGIFYNQNEYIDNSEFEFFEIKIAYGYYSGLQIDVDTAHDPHEMDNYECHYYFGRCRSACIRMFESERKKIIKYLAKNASYIGFKEMKCVGVFSNGEAVYEWS